MIVIFKSFSTGNLSIKYQKTDDKKLTSIMEKLIPNFQQYTKTNLRQYEET